MVNPYAQLSRAVELQATSIYGRGETTRCGSQKGKLIERVRQAVCYAEGTRS